MSWLLRLPLFVLLIGLAAAAMLVPAMHAYVVRDLEVARAFFYSAVVGFALFGLLGITTASFNVRRQARSHLISMMACFSVLPLYLALPFAEVVRDTHFLNAYVEMVSCITTTGLTLFEAERLPDSLHLWRALVGWLGGFFIWVAAIAVLAPLSLGGFEVDSSSSAGQGSAAATATDGSQVDASARILRYATRFAPVYALITGALWVALLIAGETSLVAVSHAMSTIATSGISPLDGGTTEAVSGYRGEAIVWLFFIFALSRVTFSVTERRDGWHSIVQDPEVRVGVVLIAVLPVLLYVRHGLVTFEDGAIFTLSEGIASLWGGFFTVASFLTTTGFVSSAWTATQTWSGLDNPGILLMGLAIFGGGVATTAGGVKLLRVYALYKHGLREMERLVQPSSIGGAGQRARRFRRQGAYVAWIFFMLFATSIAAITVLLALAGLSFDEALVVATATLSTTGPLVNVAMENPIPVSQWDPTIKAVSSAAMVLGRLETLVIIALLNPEFWR